MLKGNTACSNSRYAVLFESVKIGPVTAPNRFYQTPHCNGMGHLRPQALAAMRGIKAEGGWGVVSTEETEIHPSSDVSPYAEGRLWSDDDIPAHALVTKAIHRHGALAAIQLAHNGASCANWYSRLPPLSPSSIASISDFPHPVQARAMNKKDLRDLRRWHRLAARRAKCADYDIVYLYAGHNLSVCMHFLSPRYNQRSDEYGGSVENRARLIGELLAEIKDEVGDSCAVAFRFAVDELRGKDGISWEREGQAVLGMFGEMPDLWDVNISDWSNDSQTARFAPHEGYQESYVCEVKKLTTKPVVGVGRFTSPDTMVSQIRRGVLDFIGAARPSIADPFLPAKIRVGRTEEIRECIGCNICVSGDSMMTPIRCTQNPTMGEEWRRKWHPENIPNGKNGEPVLVVGAGPAGLECALQLFKRGHPITLAEATKNLGGRSRLESRLPGLASYARVADYRESLLRAASSVDTYCGSVISAQDILDFSIPHVFLALGARWRKDGIGRDYRQALSDIEHIKILTPDDVMAGTTAVGKVVIYDLDHYYLGGIIAEKYRADGFDVAYVTTESLVSSWTVFTLEQHRIQTALLEKGVTLHLNRAVVGGVRDTGGLEISCVYTGHKETIACDTLILVTEREPNDELYEALSARESDMKQAGIKTLLPIGDCHAPGTIAAAVYSGHKAAREFLADDNDEMSALVRWERPFTGK